MAESSTIRINRFFTDAGKLSRREADRAIEAGRVTVDGRVARLGDQVADGQVVCLDGVEVSSSGKRAVILAYHKPRGIECTSDPRVRENIIDAVNYSQRVFHIGRLDKDSEGLILLTNMGEIVNKILRARYFHEKEYLVDCDDAVSDASIQALSRGIELDDGPTRPCTVERVTSRRLRFVLTEGRNRQIRRMVAAIGREVVRLKRVRVMSVTLDTLAAGTWRELDHAETQTLLSQLAPDTVDEGCFDAE